jgi:hypothetical protein
MRCGKPGHYSKDCPTRPALGRALFTIEGIDEEIVEEYDVLEEGANESPDALQEAENLEAAQELPGEI